jgi:methylglyoxal synthase
MKSRRLSLPPRPSALNLGAGETPVLRSYQRTTERYIRHMSLKRIPPGARKTIALIAHDNKKQDLLDWARFNRDTLAAHRLIATGTTGGLLEGELGLRVLKLRSGPLGGDQQIGAKIAEGEVDSVIFFWDPLEPHPHDVDVKALLRIAVVYNVPIACNRSTADFLISSPLMSEAYEQSGTEAELAREERSAE